MCHTCDGRAAVLIVDDYSHVHPSIPHENGPRLTAQTLSCTCPYVATSHTCSFSRVVLTRAAAAWNSLLDRHTSTSNSEQANKHQTAPLSDLARPVAMAASLTAAENRQLRSLFQLVDRDQSGSITKQELASLLTTLNSPRSARPTHTPQLSHPHLALPTTSEAIDSLIAECDTNHDGEIDYAEFAAVMSKRAGSRYGREEVMDAMRMFEARGGGGGQLSVELVERAVRMLDVSGMEMRGGSGGGSGGYNADGAFGLEEKRQQMLDMLAQLRVDYGGRFAYEQVDNTARILTSKLLPSTACSSVHPSHIRVPLLSVVRQFVNNALQDK